jgi:pimeloyl-ACP methyl ester carboxylesterase
MPKAKIDPSCELFYDIHDFSDPWKEPEVVLLHHAAAGSVSRWHHWVPRLARHFKVVRFDARGHDRSTVPPPDHRWDIESMAADVDKLLQVLNIDQVHFIGASAGGIIGQQFAATFPERVKSLVLIAAKPGMAHSNVDYAQWREVLNTKGVKALFDEQIPIRFDPERDDPGLIEWFNAEAAKTPVNVLTTMVPYLATVDLVPILPQIQAPTLIISAGHDPLEGESTDQLLLDHIPRVERVVLEVKGHNISNSAPDLCLDAVFAFYRKLEIQGLERA